MSISCIYHATLGMRVVKDEDKQALLDTGAWFRHPNDVGKVKEIKEQDNGQIRRQPRKRKSDCEHPTSTHGS